MQTTVQRLSQSPLPPPHVLIVQANLSGPPSESFQSFQRSLLARKYLPYNNFVCQGKHFMITRGLGKKKLLRKPMKSPKLHVENPATL